MQDLVHTFENKALGQEQDSARGQTESDIWSRSYQDERQQSIPRQQESWSQDYVNGQEALQKQTVSVWSLHEDLRKNLPDSRKSEPPQETWRLGSPPSSPPPSSPLGVLVSPPEGFGDPPWENQSPREAHRGHSKTPPPVLPKPRNRAPPSPSHNTPTSSSCGDSGVSSPTCLSILPSAPPQSPSPQSTLSSRSSALSWSTADSSFPPCSLSSPEAEAQPRGRLFQEELDCESIYRELISLYPRTGRLEPLFQPLGGKTRADFLEGVLNITGMQTYHRQH